MVSMVLQKDTYDVKQRAIQEAFQACVDKLGIRVIKNRRYVVKVTQSTIEWMVNTLVTKCRLI